MAQDSLAELGYLFLGSRMKRLAERMQADAHKIFKANGHAEFPPAYYAVLATLDLQDDVPVSDLVDRLGISQPAITRSLSGMQEHGLISFEAHPTDQRVKLVHLTQTGRVKIADLKATAWRDIRNAAADLTRGVEGDVVSILDQLETRLADASLDQRCGPANGMEIVDYTPDLASAFYDLNHEWISTLFVMEPTDEEVLSDPEKHIISKGGQILFVRTGDGKIIGTGALQPVGADGDFEFTKMAVKSERRGEKAGEFLLAALIRRARDMGIQKLHLLTNKKNLAAIHLYEKLGFVHDDEIMRKFASKYKRANVAMKFPM